MQNTLYSNIVDRNVYVCKYITYMNILMYIYICIYLDAIQTHIHNRIWSRVDSFKHPSHTVAGGVGVVCKLGGRERAGRGDPPEPSSCHNPLRSHDEDELVGKAPFEN